MNSFMKSLKVTFINLMKVYGLISVSLFIIVITYCMVHPEHFNSPLNWIIVIGWGVLYVGLEPSCTAILSVLILPITYWLCIFVAGKGKYLVWLNYRRNSYVFLIQITIMWILISYVTFLIIYEFEAFAIIPSYLLAGALVTVSDKKLIRQYRMNIDRTSWSLLLIFVILLNIAKGAYPLISIPLILMFFTITAFGEKWSIIPRNYTKYFLIIEMATWLGFVIYNNQFIEKISNKSLMLYIGCTILILILLNLQHRLYKIRK